MPSVSAIDPSLFSKWTADIDKARINLGIQGTSVAVVHKGEIVYAKGFGKRNDVDPFTPETLVPIASITKGFTAAAIGELVAKKKAKWDTPVNTYLPEFQLKDPRLTSEITFIDLLAHRTGLPSLNLEWYHRSESRRELIKQLKYVEPEAPLRTEWIYNNAMIAVAGEIAAVIADQPYEELVLETVTRPLGMTETGFSNKELVTKPNHALPYSCKNFDAAQKGQTHRIAFDTSYMTDAPAGDLHSNVIELASWAKAIMHSGELDGKQILDKEGIEQLRTAYSLMDRQPREPEFSIAAYGLCLMLDHYKGRLTIHHSGSVLGYRSNVVFFPDDDLAIINLSNNNVNQLPIWLPYYIADDVFDLAKTQDWLFDKAVTDTKKYYKDDGTEDPADLEKDLPPQIKGKPATRELADFAGEYTHPVAGNISFQVVKKESKEDALAFKFISFEGILDHYHFDSFRLGVLRDDIALMTLVTFVTNSSGRVEQCRLLIDKNVTHVYSRVQDKAEIAPAEGTKEE